MQAYRGFFPTLMLCVCARAEMADKQEGKGGAEQKEPLLLLGIELQKGL